MATMSDEATFHQHLLQIAQTTLLSKLLQYDKGHYAQLAVDAMFRLKGGENVNHIQVIKKPGGSLHDSYLEEGILLEWHLPPQHVEQIKKERKKERGKNKRERERGTHHDVTKITKFDRAGGGIRDNIFELSVVVEEVIQ